MNTNYSSIIKRDKIEKEILRALKIANDKTGMLTEENRNRIQRAFDVLKREITGTTSINIIYEKPIEINTKAIKSSSVSFSDLKNNKAILYEKSSVGKSSKDDIRLIEEALDEIPGKNILRIDNKYLFKCPFNLVILSYNNEKEFAKYLQKEEYIKEIDL
jgi:type III restriction enzyme